MDWRYLTDLKVVEPSTKLHCLVKPLYSEVLALAERSKGVDAKAKSHQSVVKKGGERQIKIKFGVQIRRF